MSYNRYSGLINDNGKMSTIPYIKIPQKISDKEEVYIVGFTRLDLLSYKYYEDANYDWLILLANPNLNSLEFKINDNSIIRIPYPLDVSLSDYKEEVNKYNKYYNII